MIFYFLSRSKIYIINEIKYKLMIFCIKFIVYLTNKMIKGNFESRQGSIQPNNEKIKYKKFNMYLNKNKK